MLKKNLQADITQNSRGIINEWNRSRRAMIAADPSEAERHLPCPSGDACKNHGIPGHVICGRRGAQGARGGTGGPEEFCVRTDYAGELFRPRSLCGRLLMTIYDGPKFYNPAHLDDPALQWMVDTVADKDLAPVDDRAVMLLETVDQRLRRADDNQLRCWLFIVLYRLLHNRDGTVLEVSEADLVEARAFPKLPVMITGFWIKLNDILATHLSNALS